MIHNFDTMRELIEKLNYYTKLYDEGHPAISDKEWDDMYFQLQTLEKETGVVLSGSPTNEVNYFTVNKLKKVEHSHLMLSLDKTKSEEDVISFLSGHDGIAMAKMDGLTCSIKYLNGKLVSAETRGNGVTGEDITHNIICCKGIPIEISIEDEVIIDGEVICTYDDFKEFSDEYANPRNFASGSIRLLNSKECEKRNLTFIAWDCIKGLDYCASLSEKLFMLSGYGFEFVPYIPLPKDIISKNKIHHSIILIQNWAKDEGFPIDGIVFKYDDCKYYQSLGYTGHHFRGGLAFKFYDEEYKTTLQDIEWSIGKTGQLTPIAIFDPVNDGESVVTRASLHNLNIMKQILGETPHKGQKIWVCKQNQIIPQVTRSIPDFYDEPGVDWKERILTPPSICPICGGNTYIQDDFLYCSNPNCEGKFINRLDHFVGKKGLDIKGLSKATLQKLIDWSWINNLHDLFTLELHYDKWIKKEGFGIKSVDNILQAIQDSRNCELWQFISALSIPLIGSTYAKQIAKRFDTWDSFLDYIIQPHCDFLHWENFGYEINKSLKKFDYTEANELVKNILYLKNSLYIDPQEIKIVNSNIDGKTFVITGKLTTFKNRDEAKQKIENAGGKVIDSVSKKTDYLVNNDINSTSSKNQKAKQLNIPIISEAQLLDML